MPDTISFSQIASWKRCRYHWFWRYDLGIVKRKEASQVDVGTLCHAGVESYLTGKQPFEGIHEKALDLLPKEPFEEERQAVNEAVERATSVLADYLNRDYGLLPAIRPEVVEMEWSLPIPGMRGRHIEGRFDTIGIDSRGELWLVEYKFPKVFRTEEDIALSTQLAIYQWAAHRLGYPVVGVIYNQRLQRLPAIPEQNKNGSTSRKEIYTTWETYARVVSERGEDPANYAEEMVPKLAGKTFSKQFRVYRTPEQVKRYVVELRAVAGDIFAKRKRIFACESSINCGGCSYRDLCLEVARGRDPNPLIESAYTSKHHDTDNDPAEAENAGESA